MPIVYEKEKGWTLDIQSKEEHEAVLEAGKKKILNEIASAYTCEKYREYLIYSPNKNFFNA